MTHIYLIFNYGDCRFESYEDFVSAWDSPEKAKVEVARLEEEELFSTGSLMIKEVEINNPEFEYKVVILDK